jgi:predicted secreted protein
MSVIAGAALKLAVSDGGAPETYLTVSGVSMNRLEVSQRAVESRAVAAHDWSQSLVANERKLVLQCELVAQDLTVHTRLRTVALSGSTTNIRLTLASGVTLTGPAILTQYTEQGEADAPKLLRCRFESAGVMG